MPAYLRHVHKGVDTAGDRWRRLQPSDLGDAGLIAVMLIGLVLYGASAFWEISLGTGVMQLVVDIVLMTHGSTPVLFFLASAFYLTRWGRSLGRNKRWAWAGLVATVPLWLLAGLPVAIRGAGDITVFFVFWNLLALTVMMVGVRLTLGPLRGRRKKTESG